MEKRVEIFITGASGYIGGAVTRRLVADGHRVTGLVRSQEAAGVANGSGATPFLGNLQEEAWIPRAAEADCIIHAAASEGPPAMAREPVWAAALCDLLEGTGKTFVFTSGTGVIWDTGDAAFSEDMAFTPPPFLAPRVEAEAVVARLNERKARGVVLRPPPVYGHGGGLIIPRGLIAKAVETGESAIVAGSADNRWSAVYLDDLVDLYARVVSSEVTGLFHASDGRTYRTAEIAAAVARATGAAGGIREITLDAARERFGPYAPYWSIASQSSADRARRELGWAPSGPSLVSEIEDGSYARSEKAV
jgi:nucleoside-diphosphate-sugar epimerase